MYKNGNRHPANQEKGHDKWGHWLGSVLRKRFENLEF